MRLGLALLLAACAAPRPRSGHQHPRNRSAYPPPGLAPCIAAVCVVPR